MSECLSLETNSWWKTFIAHALWVRSMLLLALLVHFIAKALCHSAILALMMRQMLVFTFLLLLLNIVFKTLMFYNLVSFLFGDGFLHGSVLDHLDIFVLFLFLDFLDNSSIAVFSNRVILDFWGFEKLSSAIPERRSFFFFFF
jgi:hypothetical protein